jgi:Ca2+-binding RTX toxin-like protein
MRTLISGAAVTLLATTFFGIPASEAAVPTCFGKIPTVVLTDGNDRYVTQEDVAEVVWAGAGDDAVVSNGDSGSGTRYPGDYICGGPGKDYILGDAGPDHLNGGDGNDTIEGWVGSDVTQGNRGNDVVEDDPIDSNLGGNDILRGGPGEDKLANNAGFDRVYGQGGNDDLVDWECSVTYLSGGAGNDHIESYRSSFEGQTCDRLDGSRSPGDTVVGGSELDEALLSYADQVTGVEDFTFATPDW